MAEIPLAPIAIPLARQFKDKIKSERDIWLLSKRLIDFHPNQLIQVF
ncbi:hypothetical protein M3599_17855 [Niallia circulans]|nr:hypothetical protein [Niallia circulans]MCM2982792.1 hypothetical protein [Niallia circulans]